jgi:hypothetical protein
MRKAIPATGWPFTYKLIAESCLQNFTLGAVREPSLAWKYAVFSLKPRMFAQMLLGNCRTNVL